MGLTTIRPDSKICKCGHNIKSLQDLPLYYELNDFDIWGNSVGFIQCKTCAGFYSESPDNRRDFVAGGNVFIDENFGKK